MKKIKSIYVVLVGMVLTLAMSGCQDTLTTDSQSALMKKDFYTTQGNIDRALIGVYGCMKPFSIYYFAMSENRSDNMLNITEAKKNEYADCAQFNSTGLLNDNIVYNCWADHYALIAAANALLANIDNVSFTNAGTAQQYKAEARFLRALAYFDLVRFFGRVPVSTKEQTIDEAFALKQSEPAEVYAQIVDDLTFAEENLADEAKDYMGTARPERATKTAAQALLGKVYMQMAGYPINDESAKDKAKNYLGKVLTTVGLLSGDNVTGTLPSRYWAINAEEWNSMWFHENDNKFFIFEIQYVCSLNQGNPMTPLTHKSESSKTKFCNANLVVGPHAYVERSFVARHFVAPENVDEDRIPLDKRYPNSINLISESQSSDDEIIASDGDAFMPKFFEHKVKRANFGYPDMDDQIVTRTYWPQNFPVLRLEDVMLLYAECVGKAQGLPLLNLIHNRALGYEYPSSISESRFQQYVMEERRIELLGEGHRWFDEVRQKTFVDDIKAKFEYYRENCDKNKSPKYSVYANQVTLSGRYYPIPLSQMQVREGLYQQNEGY